MKTKFKQALAGILILAIGVFSCKKEKSVPAPKTFVLVHGAWQSPFVWDSVKAQLSRAGQNVIVVQLPGHGTDTTNPGLITVNSYRDQIVSAINSVNGKVVLVGHSLSGYAISAVEEQIPNRIDKLVFLAAYIPSAGLNPNALAHTDAQSHLGPVLIQFPNGLPVLAIDPLDSIAPIFCPDAPAVLQAKVVANYRPDPIIPFTDTVGTTAANFGRADKYYIHTLQDEVIGIDLQTRMAQNAGITNVYALNTSHSPFLSKPDSVTSILLTIAGLK